MDRDPAVCEETMEKYNKKVQNENMKKNILPGNQTRELCAWKSDYEK